jgi:uncharacterized membrane protein
MHLYLYLLIIALMVLLDGIWLSLNLKAYNDVTKAVQGSNIRVDYTGMLLSYVCVFCLLAFYVVPAAQQALPKNASLRDKLFISIKCGGVLGLLVYGVYNSTSKAILENYTWNIAIRDSMWGASLFSMVCFGVLLTDN